MSVVLLEKGAVEGVHVLTLNDPDKRNAMSPRLQRELADAVASVRADNSARVLVVAANGPAFSAGADLPGIFGEPGRTTGEMRDHLRGSYGSFLSVRDLEIPTIAAVHGPAVGAGLILAMSCDIRLAGPRASFGVTFTKLGLHPGGGCSHYVVEALGRQRALALLLAGGVVRVEEALAAGMILDIAEDPLAAARDLAANYAALDPELARNIKRSVTIAAKGDFDQTLEFEAWAQAESAVRPAFVEAVANFGRK